MVNKLIWLCLWVASKLYASVTTLRNLCYDAGIFHTFSAGVPVVCVGNLTAGGSGKTPLVLALVRELIARGHTPVILSRGYGGRLVGPHRVSEEDGAGDVGDEPALMARRGVCPVFIARDRVAGAQYIAQSRAASVIVLDDGMQHRRLDRVCNLATFFVGNDAAVDAIVRGHLLPLGRFRENREAGLRRADVIALCERGGRCHEAQLDQIRAVIPPPLPLFVVGAAISKPRRNGDDLEAGRSVWLFCAIANPEGFVESVRWAGYQIAGVICFPDHHRLSVNECSTLEDRAREHAAALVCTEKDWVKLSPPLSGDAWVVSLEAQLPVELVDVVEEAVCRGSSGKMLATP